MDVWKPFRNVTKDRAPQAAILFDKFHIMRHLGEALDMRHLGEALDKVRKAEYARLSDRDRRFRRSAAISSTIAHPMICLSYERQAMYRPTSPGLWDAKPPARRWPQRLRVAGAGVTTSSSEN
jgi:transposase